jgi:hypothetical protein
MPTQRDVIGDLSRSVGWALVTLGAVWPRPAGDSDELTCVIGMDEGLVAAPSEPFPV